MKKSFLLTRKDNILVDLVNATDKKTLAVWAIDCAERVLPFFEKKYPEDSRPRNALLTLKKWLDTGVFKMEVIRCASLSSHAAARETGEDNPARSAARACGQAVATAHVARHAYGSAIYSQQAVFRASNPENAEKVSLKERNWQYNHLLMLRKKA